MLCRPTGAATVGPAGWEKRAGTNEAWAQSADHGVRADELIAFGSSRRPPTAPRCCASCSRSRRRCQLSTRRVTELAAEIRQTEATIAKLVAQLVPDPNAASPPKSGQHQRAAMARWHRNV